MARPRLTASLQSPVIMCGATQAVSFGMLALLLQVRCLAASIRLYRHAGGAQKARPMCIGKGIRRHM